MFVLDTIYVYGLYVIKLQYRIVVNKGKFVVFK